MSQVPITGAPGSVEYARAKPDPLSDAAAGIVQHMNVDRKDALAVLARVFAGIEAQEVNMTSVDRLGFHRRLKTGDRVHGRRIAFPREVKDRTEARAVFIEMVRACS